MVAALKRGNLVIVTRLDRLGRSVRELLNLLADLDHAGVAFKSLADPWCDTTAPHGGSCALCWAASPSSSGR
jgi:DNA invertase Pin-like site-specific DNA recombinase